MRQSQQPEFVTAHYTCDVHKLYSATACSMDHCSSDVSGLLSLGISHQGSAGMYQHLVSTLFGILQSELIVTYGVPDRSHSQFRQHIFDVFLPVHRGHRCRKTNAKRRFILHQLLNGNWQADQLEHVCQYGCCKDFNDTLAKFKRFCIWALCPTKCPKYCRSRWTNYDLAIDWAGILGNLCNGRILALLVGKITSKGSAITTAQEAKPQHDAITDAAEKWLELAGDEVGLQLVSAASEEGQPANDPRTEAAPPELNEGPDWVKINEQHRMTAKEWVSSMPGIRLVIMKIVAAPLLATMQKFLFISSPKWERKQVARAARGQQRSYRVLEGALGHDLTQCMDSLLNSARAVPLALPSSAMRRCIRTLQFRMVASALGSLHAYLRVERQSLKFQWFKILQQQSQPEELERVYQIPPCMADELSSKLLSLFPTVEDACSHECQSIAVFLGCALFTDIAKVEARHSSNREVTFARARGWFVDMSDLNAKFVSRQFAARKQKRKDRKKPGPRPRKPLRKKNTRGGGPWRAFIHHRYRGMKFTKELMQQISREYNNLSAEEKAFYLQVGKEATDSHRHGFSSFSGSDRVRRQKSTNTPVDEARMAEPGEITADGVVVAADINLPDMVVVGYTGPGFEDAYEKEKLSLEHDHRAERSLEHEAEKANEESITKYIPQLSVDGTLPSFGNSMSVVPSSLTPQRFLWQPNVQDMVEAQHVQSQSSIKLYLFIMYAMYRSNSM